MLMRLVFPLLLAFAISGLAPSSPQAAEVITSFDSVIDVDKSGPIKVTETISVIAEGVSIKHGIYRDLPLTMRDHDGAILRVGFSIQSIRRDGDPENYFTESIQDGIRIYIGKPDVLVDAGQHKYEITYMYSRKVLSLDDHDELNWNVTGSEWGFPIRQATATVNLPDGVQAEKAGVYTGPAGSKKRNATISDLNGAPFFKTTIPLSINEGMTIVVWMPKGSILVPSSNDCHDWTVPCP